MDFKFTYEELLELNKKQQKEIDLLKSRGEGRKEIAKEMVFKAFHSASQLMALSNLDSGIYVDVNDAFLNTLGYSREEIIGHTSDDIHVFADFGESNKYIKLLSKLKKVSDFPVNLKKKNGEEIPFLFSAETIQLDEDNYLLTSYYEAGSLNDKISKAGIDSTTREIFETISHYLMLFCVSDDNRFYITGLNYKVEVVESVKKSDVIGKSIDETPLINRTKLVELLSYVRITGEPHKLSVSPKGDDSEGYYMGFLLPNRDIVVTWEPGHEQKSRENNIIKQIPAFEKFADILPGIIFEIDLNGKVIYANKQGLNLFGYKKEDLDKDFTIKDIFPDNFKKVQENLKTITSPGQIINNEYVARKKDGSLIPIVTHTFATFQNDKITGYRGVVTDISEQKKYEEQITREKAFLEHLVDSAAEAIVISSIQGRITMINKEFTKLFGYSPEEAVDKFINDLVVPDEFKEEALQIDYMASRNQKKIIQTIRKDKYGNRIHVTVIASSIVINNETAAYLGIYRDITIERKNQLLQEILYNISNSALKQFDIKEIYPTIVHELSKIWDTHNFYIALYDKASETLSLPFFADEKDNFNELPIRKTITGWVINHNKSVLLKEDDIKKMEEAGEIDLVGTACKVWMGVPLRVENEIIGVICLQSYTDENKFSPEDLNILEFISNQIAIVIQRRSILDNLIIARQKAEEAAQSKQLFISTMSHEIRTPLNDLIGIANLLLRENPREDQMELIKTLRFSGNHLQTLVNDVLDYSKMESGKIAFEQTQFNLMDFLDEIKRSYSFWSKEKQLDFDVIKSKNLPAEVIGDPIRLNQILSNLLSNALKFTLKGRIMVKVRELRRTENQSNIEFTIEDTGIGIPKDKHKEIFDHFTQASTDTTRRFGGTGLGLAICKKLVELQGGNINITSEPDKGTTFKFILNFGISEQQHQTIRNETDETYKGLEGKRILIAEDNKINFFVVSKFLTSWGAKVTQAENGQMALNILKNEEFDLILMDLQMPILDGIETTKIIRDSNNPKIKDLPIIALTAAIMSESHDRIEHLNINDYVLKPFKPQDLYNRILKHIK